MKNLAIAVPWMLVIVLTCVVVAQYRSLSAAPEIDNEASSDAPPIEVASAPTEADSDLEARVNSLKSENDQLKEFVASQTEEINSLANDLARATEMVERKSEAESAPEPEEDRVGMSAELAEVHVQRRYGAFLAGLGLSPEREAAIREALLRVYVDFGNDSGISDAERSILLRQEMARVLSPQELEDFDEYEEALPAQMLRQAFESQVNSMAAGLNDQTQALLVDVLVEEALLADLAPVPEGASAAYPLIQRMNAYAATAARFDGSLSEAESAALNRFINQQYAQLETTVASIQRAEAAGATATVNVNGGMVSVEIEQRR